MKNKVKIIRIINRLNIGGPTYNVVLLSKYLSSKFETTLLSGMKLNSEESSEHILKLFNIKAIYLKNLFRKINLLNDIKSYFEIRKHIRKHKPKILHTHASKAGAIGRIAAIHERVPIIIHTFHGNVFQSYFGKLKSRIILSIERYLASRSTKIIAISKTQKKELIEKYKLCNPNKIEIIMNGFDLDNFYLNRKTKRNSFRKEFNLNNEVVAIGIIGRLTPIKNQSFLLKIISSILSKNKFNIRLFIVGDGEDLEKLKKLCVDLNLSFSDKNDNYHNKTICFTSWRKDMDRIISGLDIVALTSLNEGTPVCLIEAQAGSKAIISTNVGGVKDIVKNNKSGFLIDNFDFKEFEKKLIQLIENPSLRNKMGSYSTSYIKEKFTYKSLIKNMEILYLNLLNNLRK